jgi:phosphoribosyl-ATP pyrophosphohydrolase
MPSRPDVSSQVLDRLYEVIESRREERPPGSYVVTLLDAGLPGISAKLREESTEVIRAAFDEDAHAVAHEAADVVFHLFVLLAARRIPPTAVYAELARRFGIGGLAEKAARSGSPSGAGRGEGE